MLPDTRLPMADPATDTHDPIMLPDTRLLMADPATDTQYPTSATHKDNINPMASTQCLLPVTHAGTQHPTPLLTFPVPCGMHHKPSDY